MSFLCMGVNMYDSLYRYRYPIYIEMHVYAQGADVRGNASARFAARSAEEKSLAVM